MPAGNFLNVLEMFRDIHAHAKRVGGEVLVVDDAVQRSLGFAVREGPKINGQWKFPLTRLRGSFIDIEDEKAAEQIADLFRTEAGRVELAQMLTEGTFPGA